MVCPQDEAGWRSYSMNHWASSKVNSSVLLVRKLWSPSMPNSSQMILLAESWTNAGGPLLGGWTAPPTVGLRGNDAGRLFGAKGGVSPFFAGRWGMVNCELTYNRHRNGRGAGTEPVGRLNIAYADGHVETLSNEDLADQTSGLSTFNSLWSERDFQYP